MSKRPVFQHQGPKTNCVIQAKELGWKSCTAYAMAMLIDAATDGAHRPKGCRVRVLVAPQDVDEGLSLRQVAAVASGTYHVPIAVRTGGNTIKVKTVLQRVRAGRGFLLQGNNAGWGMKPANHAVYVHEVRKGSIAEPKEALVYDPQRKHERWIPWSDVLGFAAALRLNDAGTKVLGPGRFYAGFAPTPMTPHERASRDVVAAGDGVDLLPGARKLPRPIRLVAVAPPKHTVNVRSTPKSLAKANVIEHLARGTLFIAYQAASGAKPAGAPTATWLGNRDATWWIHVSGLRRIGGDA